jgi:hypothetical protein
MSLPCINAAAIFIRTTPSALLIAARGGHDVLRL